MLYVKLRCKDGTAYHGTADTLEEVQEIVERRAFSIAEECWSGDLPHIFPIYWAAVDEDTREIVASGFVDETGYTF